MPTWQDVRDLRKSGQAEEALRVAESVLADSPEDLQMRSQAEWACFDLVKENVSKIQTLIDANARPDQADFKRLYESLRNYERLKPRIPEMAASNILYQIAKVGRHFERFVPFLQWCGPDCLRPEDFEANIYKERVTSSWAIRVVREAAGWVKARPDATVGQLAFVVGLAKAVQQKAKDTDKTWLDWDLAVLLRRAGDRHAAAELIIGVLRRKRTEFWAWAEAARIHNEEQPELAIACFCQALRLGAEPKYLGKVHRELAELLAAAGEFAQATQETLIAVEIYDREGWRHPPELEALLQSTWYDPSLAAAEPKQFYSQHADDALTLCFDEVHEYPATYLGMTEMREGKKPKPRFAFRPANRVVSIVGRRGARILSTLEPGSPVTLLVGIEAQRRDVLEVLPRPDGVHWDCAEANEGVISWRSADGTSITAYCGREREIRFPLAAWPVLLEAALGSGVRVRGATNPSNDRFEAHCIELALVPQHADIGVFRGALRRASKGFGFIEDVFVPASLLEAGLQAAHEYEVVAVQSFDKSKERYGWRAVAISSC